VITATNQQLSAMKSLMRHDRSGEFIKFLEGQRDSLSSCSLTMDGPALFRVQGAALAIDGIVKVMRKSVDV